MKKQWLSIALNLLGWIGGIGLLALLAQQAAAVAAQQPAVDVGWLALAVIIGILGHAPQYLIGKISTSTLQHPIPHGAMYRLWFFSQTAKYVPGGVWQVASRAGMYTQRGLPPVVASAATLWEILSILLGSLILCLFAVGVIPPADLPLDAAALGALILLVGAALSQMRFVWATLARRKISGARKILAMIDELGTRRFIMLVQMTLTALLTWLIIGAGFACLLRAFDPLIIPTYGEATILFSAAWTVGFLVIFTPSGLGAREAMLTVLLAGYFPNVAVIVLAARLWWHVCEGANIAFAGLWQIITVRPFAARSA